MTQTTNGPTNTTKTSTGRPVFASEEERIREAYLRMAREVRYRPAAPRDGFGNIHLSPQVVLSKAAGAKADEKDLPL